MKNIIVTLTGPSCSGKSTLLGKMVETGKYTEVVSTTTREPRVGEVDGVTYHFTDKENFDKESMLEYIEYNGNIYGASIKEFTEKFESGKIPAIIVEPNGAGQIIEKSKELGWTVVSVFVDCPVDLQNERYLERVLKDYKDVLTKDLASYDKFFKQYVGRLNAIRSVESDWGDRFNDVIPLNQSLYIERYDRYTEDVALKNINSFVKSLT